MAKWMVIQAARYIRVPPWVMLQHMDWYDDVVMCMRADDALRADREAKLTRG